MEFIIKDNREDVKRASKERERLFKQEISRKASMANKRLKRLEKNGLTDLPAYRNWYDYKGGVKFSVKGKSHNELVAEMARLDRFINAKTSTVRGANATLKEIANNSNISYKRIGELNTKLKGFFDLYSKTQQYLESGLQIANSIGSDTVMNTISNYVKDNKINLNEASVDFEDMVENISELLGNQYMEQAQDQIFDSFENLF